jgi:hypothetical protein
MKEIKPVRSCVSVCACFKCKNQVTDFHGNWPEQYAIGGHPNVLSFGRCKNLWGGYNIVVVVVVCPCRSNAQ